MYPAQSPIPSSSNQSPIPPSSNHEWFPQILSDIRSEWRPFFLANQGYLQSIDRLLKLSGPNITPRGLEIFIGYQWVNPYNIKVVIIGKSPDPRLLPNGMTKAMGASYSLRPLDTDIKNLNTIYEELSRSIPGFTKPSHGYLETWGQQGVFFLNSSLTTLIGQSGAHPIQWKIFLDKTIEYIEKCSPNLCYIRWGQDAKKLPVSNSLMKFDAKQPVGNTNGQGFFGCNHFNLVNEHLMSRGIEPIDWTSICRVQYKQTE